MTNEPEHIVRFKEMAGFILGRLYEEHPGDLAFEAADFYLNAVPSDDDTALFEKTVLYLVRNGYVHQDRQMYLQLTSASWDVLQKPNPLLPVETVGSSLMKWGRDTTSEVSKGLAGKTVESALKAVATAIGAIAGS